MADSGREEEVALGHLSAESEQSSEVRNGVSREREKLNVLEKQRSWVRRAGKGSPDNTTGRAPQDCAEPEEQSQAQMARELAKPL